MLKQNANVSKEKGDSICIAILVIAVITTMIITMMITMNAVVIITADVTVMMTRPNHAQVLVTAKSDQQDLEVKEVQ